MISIDLQITYPECLNVTAEAMEKAGAGGIMNALVAHFDQRGGETNKRGWPSLGVWGKIADSTGVNLQDDGAAVTISDIVFWRKYAPDGPITPKRGDFLTIPATAAANAAGPPSGGGAIPELHMGTAFNPYAHGGIWMRCLMAADTGTKLRRVKLKKKDSDGGDLYGEKRVKDKNQPAGVWYWLVRSANPPKDPNAIPEISTLTDAAHAAIVDKLTAAAARRKT